MSSNPSLNEDRIQSSLNEAERLISLRRYTLAIQVLQQLQQEIQQNSVDLDIAPDLLHDSKELLNGARDQRTDLINRSREYIDDLQNKNASDLVNIDLSTMSDYLNDWKVAITVTNADGEEELDEEYREFLTIYQRKETQLRQRQRAQQVFERIREQVNSEWQEAERLGQMEEATVATSTLLEYYARARDIARDAAANHPDNHQLQALAEKAEALRDQVSRQEEAMTTAVQTHEYQITLDYIESVADQNIHVMVYDNMQQPIGRMPPDEARQVVMDQAKEYAHSKAGEYYDEASRMLREFAPREALGVLNQRSQFVRFMSGDDLSDLNNLELTVREDIEVLERAETLADEALARLNVYDAPDAWAKFQLCLAEYKGAVKSERIQSVKEAILEQSRRELSQAADEIESLFDDDKFTKAARQAAQVINQYRDIDQGLLDLIRNIEVLKDRIEERAQVKKDIHDTLTTLNDQLYTDPRGADQGLARLLDQYGDTGFVDTDDLFETVQSNINIRLDVVGELERLRQYAGSTDLKTVENTIATARQHATSQPAYGQDFEQLANELDLRRQFLVARDYFTKHRYGEALDLLSDLLENPDLTDDDWVNEIIALQTQIKDRFKEFENNQQLFEQAHNELKAGNYPGAWAIVEDIEPLNSSERQQRRSLEDDLKKQWRRHIIDQLEALTIESEFNLKWLDEQLCNLQKLDGHLHDEWQRNVQIFRLAQEARQAENNERKRAQALDQWRTLAEMVPREMRPYVDERIALLNQVILGIEKKAIIQQANTALGDLRQLDKVLERLIEFEGRLSQLRDDSPLYNAWYLETVLIRAQCTQESEVSRGHFARARAEVSKLDAELNLIPDKYRQEVDVWLDVAWMGELIGEARVALDSSLTLDGSFEALIEALEKWEDVSDFHAKLVFLNNWVQERRQKLIDGLRNRIASESLQADNLHHFAKLLILNPNDGMAATVVRQLPALQISIKQDTEDMVNNLAAPRGLKTMLAQVRPTDILIEQRNQLETQKEVLDTLYNMASWLERIKQLQDQMEPLRESSGALRVKLDDAIRKLEMMLGQVRIFQGELEGLQPAGSWDGSQDGDFWAEVNQKLNELQQNVGEIDVVLQNHVAIDRLRNMFNQKRSDFRALNKALKEIYDRTVESKFDDDLLRLLTKVEEYDSLMQTSYAYSYRVPNDFEGKGNMVRGWDDVVEFIRESVATLKVILDWSKPFGVPQTISGLGMPAPSMVVDWNEVKAQAKAAREEADFEKARSILEKARSDDDPHRTTLTLEKALNVAQSPPRATQSELNQSTETLPPDQRYAVALKDAGTLRGRRILEWMQQQVPDYRNQNNEVAAELALVDQDQTRCQSMMKDLEHAMQQIASEMRRMRRPNKRNRRLSNACEKARHSLEEFKQRYPKHPYVVKGVWEASPVFNACDEY